MIQVSVKRSQVVSSQKTIYISITGITYKRLIYLMIFMEYELRVVQLAMLKYYSHCLKKPELSKFYPVNELLFPVLLEIINLMLFKIIIGGFVKVKRKPRSRMTIL